MSIACLLPTTFQGRQQFLHQPFVSTDINISMQQTW